MQGTTRRLRQTSQEMIKRSTPEGRTHRGTDGGHTVRAPRSYELLVPSRRASSFPLTTTKPTVWQVSAATAWVPPTTVATPGVPRPAPRTATRQPGLIPGSARCRCQRASSVVVLPRRSDRGNRTSRRGAPSDSLASACSSPASSCRLPMRRSAASAGRVRRYTQTCG